MNEFILQLNFSSSCQNGCPFCSKSRDPLQNMNIDEAISNIDYFSSLGRINRLILSGGEIYDDGRLEGLLEALSPYDIPEKVLIASGLGVPQRTASLINDFFDRLVLSITPISENYIETEEFKKKLEFIESVPRLRVQTNTVVHGHNLNYLTNTVMYLQKLQIVYPTITLVFPLGEAAAESAYLPKEDLAVPVIEELTKLFAAAGKSPVIKGIPMCYLGSDIRQYVGYTEGKGKYFVTKKRQRENSIRFKENIPFEKFSECSACIMNSRCDGFWRIYLDRQLFSRPKPIYQEGL